MAALKPISAKEPLNATVFQGEFKEKKNKKNTIFILNSMILTELGL